MKINGDKKMKININRFEILKPYNNLIFIRISI